MSGSVKTLYTEIQANSVLVSAGFSKVMPPATYVRTYVTTVVDYFLPRFVFPYSLSVDPEIATVEYWYSREFLFAVAVLALLALLVPLPFFGISVRTAITALFLYGLLPIVRNTATGLQDIPRALRESACGPFLWRSFSCSLP